MKKVIILLGLAGFFFSCCNSGKTASMLDSNLLDHPQIWEAGVDDIGSSFVATNPLVDNSLIDIEFTIAKIGDDGYPYVELKCFPEVEFDDTKGIDIEYECDKELVVKLSQKDFSGDGNGTYSHCQYVLPATNGAKAGKTLLFSDFKQPGWTPAESRAICLNLKNISALYFVPNVDYDLGELSKLKIYLVKFNKRG